MIVIVFGLPGSGKSYFASRLAKKLGADYINSDRVRHELVPNPNYSSEEKQFIYKKLMEAMYDHVKRIKPLVMDGTFYLQKTRDDFNQLAFDLNAELYWIEIRAEEDIIRKRLLKKRKYSDADFEVYKEIKKDYAPFTLGKCISLKSTNENIEKMLEQALIFLNTK